MVRQLLDQLNGMDQKMHLHHLDVIDNFRDHLHPLDVVYLVALQNLVAQIQDEVLTFRDVHLVHLQVVAVDEELRHQLRKDYFQDGVGVEQQVMFHRKLKMDCYQDAVQQACYLLLVPLLLVLEQVRLPVQRFLHVML